MRAGAGQPGVGNELPTPCARRDKWYRPCRFEPRYDLSPVQWPAGTANFEGSASSLEKFRHRTYVGDVCITCGRVVHPIGNAP